MYYLVRDYCESKKKIFSDKDDVEEYFDKFEGKLMLVVYNYEKGKYSDTRNGKQIYFDQYDVLEKNEKIFNLIDVGDLVEFKNDSINKVCRKPYKIDMSIIAYDIDRLDVYLDEIIAIYKPNEKGDYIKVWRKEKNINEIY